MTERNVFLCQLQEAFANKSPIDKYDFIEKNIRSFFQTPYIADYYRIIKDMDISASEKMLPKLVKAWMAFLSGDNAGLAATLRGINELELENCHESSLFYALKALVDFSASYGERIKYARLSIDILPDDDSSFYMANARLTCGQMLASQDKYRDAAEMFAGSYSLFLAEDMHFPASVALANELLNRYKLGEITYVIDECNKALVMSSSFVDEAKEYWHLLNLPLGMCYFELNKPNLAVRHLRLAKACIDRMKLFHMHGIIELYLFKSFYMLKDTAGMDEVKSQAEKDFGNMHYTMTDLLVSMFRIMSCRREEYGKLQPDIERFEVEYMKSSEKSHMILVETLAYLKIQGINNLITVDEMVAQLEKLRFAGLIPYTQLFLVMLAEMNYMENKAGEAVQCLREAVSIKKEYGISAGFYQVPLKSQELLRSVDSNTYNDLFQKVNMDGQVSKVPLLSAREREIMQLVAAGKSNEEIGRLLFIGIGTIKWHINHIFGKLEVKNRVQAAEKARSLGEIS